MHPSSQSHDVARAATASERWSADGPTVAILSSTPFGIRNVIHSGLLSELTDRGVRPWILVRESHVMTVREDLPPGCRIVPLQDAPATGSQRGLAAQRALLHHSFARRHGVSTQRIFERWRRRIQRDRTPAWRSVAIRSLALLGASGACYRWQLAALDRRTRCSLDLSKVREQLETIKPDLLVSTACIAYGEFPYLLAAPELGIPTLGCILSFDNLTSRGELPTFDHYAVWNERMAQQVRRFYPDRRPSNIHVTGTPQFDFHVRPEFRWTRAETLRHLGLRPSDRYVLHAANHAEFTPTEPALVAELSGRLRNVDRLRDHYVVVRPHPHDDPARWSKARGADARIIMSWPARPGEPVRASDQARLVSTLLHADACLNTASTMSLDSAVLDTPVVCVGFSWRGPGGDDPDCRELHFTDHYQPLMESGALRLVHSMDETLRELAAYVEDSSRDADARAALAAAQCGGLDGGSTLRVAALIDRLARAERITP